MRWSAAAAGIALVAAPLYAAAHYRYSDGPPPGYTGDFGESTCVTCHMDATLRQEDPGLTIDGIPQRYEPGRAYRLTIGVTRPAMGVGGFQLAVRTLRGAQAGTLRPIDARVRVTVDPTTGVAFATHTRAGIALVAPDSARWMLEWVAPDSADDSLVFSAAGNAANGDDSNFGDEILTRRKVSEPGAREK